MNNKIEVNLGLDIGIASVGWAALDANDFKIIKHGVRMFPCMEEGKEKKLNNLNRREKRSLRRQIRRTKNRKLDFIKFLIKNKFINNIQIDNNLINSFTATHINKYKFNILKLRSKGLNSPLVFSEIIAVMYWYLSNRGFHYEVAEDNSPEKENEKEKIEKMFAKYIDPKKLPIENQYSFYERNGYYRGELNRQFNSESYLKEIKQILSNSKIDKKLEEGFFVLFNRMRFFEEGPGSEEAYEKIKNKNMLQKLSDSSFNRFYLKDGKLVARENMWELSIGKCIYDGENRAPKNLLTSELFNLLNDLNNITLFTGEKLDFTDKIEIIKISFEKNENLNSIFKYLKKKYSLNDIGDIGGLRIDSKRKPLITKLDGLHSIKKVLKTLGIDFSFNDIFKLAENSLEYSGLVDEIIIEMSKFKYIEKRKSAFQRINLKFSLNWSDEIIEKLGEKLGSFSQTHAFSIDFMKEKIIPELLHSIYNQEQIICKNNFQKKNESKIIGERKYFDIKWIDHKDLIASPTIKRGIRQSFNVINDLIKCHNNDWTIKNVVVEMARELNSKAAKESQIGLQDFLRSRREMLKSQIEAIKNELNISDGKLNSVLPKLCLYIEQNGMDAYTGEKLDKNKVILDPSYVEIDHIIPHSQCFDDSQNNKVLTLSANNAIKSQKTPYYYLSPEDFNKMKSRYWQDWYLNSKDKNSAILRKKYIYLTSEKDYSNPENLLDFINRNLVDTRYITKEVLRNLQEFKLSLSNDSMFKNANIKTINGKMTSFIRKQIERKSPLRRPEYLETKDGVFDAKTGKKNRVWNGHHAEDAVFVIHGALKNPKLNKVIEKVISSPNMSSNEAKNAFSDSIDWDKPNRLDFNFISQSLNDNMNNVFFSYMLTKKGESIEFSNETLYGIKYIDNVPHKVEYLSLEELNNDQKKRKEIFEEDNYKYKIPMKQYDPETWKYLKSQVKNGDPKSPFKLDEKNKSMKIEKRLIKKIKIIKEEKELDEVMTIQKDNNGIVKSFKESLNWFKILVFKNDKNKNVILPITILNLREYKKWKNKEESEFFDKFIKNNNIDIDYGYCELHRGSIICDKKNYYYRVVGHSWKAAKLECKPIAYQQNVQKHMTINTYLTDWTVVELNSIGLPFRKIWTF